MTIHPTALVDRRAEIDPTVEVGPYVVIEGPVRVGPRTRIMPYAYLSGDTRLGADNVIHPGAVVGHVPQDLAYRGAPSGVRIGDRNVIREHAEIHRGTQAETYTVVGDDIYLMSHAHIAHNCQIGNRVVVASGALLAGYVSVGEGAFISGNCAVHQFVRVGRLAIMRGLGRASMDIVPFGVLDGTNVVCGINRVGLRRAGWSAEAIRDVARAFRTLFRVRTNLSVAMAAIESQPRSAEVDELLAFIRSAKRGVASGPPQRRGAARTMGEAE
jgi:UDP-N-acetylglucosamine acyltransferase